MKVAIVEDSPTDAGALLDTLPLALPEGTPEPQARVFEDAPSFFLAFSPGTFDLVILDCALGEGVNGVDVARSIRTIDRTVPLVFVTSSPDYAVEGYEVEAVGYVLKPVDGARLAAALERALPSPDPDPPVLLGEGPRPVPVPPNDIVWMRSEGHYLVVKLRQGEILKVRGSHASAVDVLMARPQFFVPIRGHIINLAHVGELLDGEFVMSDGTSVSVSRANRSAAREAYASFMFQTLREGLT